MEKTVFTCHTIYQIFVAYVIAKVKYPNHENLILVIEGGESIEDLAERARECGVWKNVYSLLGKKMNEQEITQWIRSKKLEDLSILHLGAWGGKVANRLSQMIGEHAIIVINEEGTASYSWMAGYQAWVDRYYTQKGREFNNMLALDKIRKGMFFDSRISVNTLEIEEEDINLSDFIKLLQDEAELNQMNELFAYNPDQIPQQIQYILFDQNLWGQRVAGNDFQQMYLSILAEAISDHPLYIKLHPSERTGEKITEVRNLVNIEATHTPWEVILINQLIRSTESDQKRIYLTYCSSAALNSMLIAEAFGVECHVILMYKAVNRLSINKILLDEKVIEQYVKYYDNIYAGNDLCDICGHLLKLQGREPDMDGIQGRINRWFYDFYFSHFQRQPTGGKKAFQLSEIKGRVVIYGAGNIGQKLYARIRNHPLTSVIAWVDGAVEKYETSLYRISSPQRLKELEFDMILIAVESENLKREIEENIVRICGRRPDMKWCRPV